MQVDRNKERLFSDMFLVKEPFAKCCPYHLKSLGFRGIHLHDDRTAHRTYVLKNFLEVVILCQVYAIVFEQWHYKGCNLAGGSCGQIRRNTCCLLTGNIVQKIRHIVLLCTRQVIELWPHVLVERYHPVATVMNKANHHGVFFLKTQRSGWYRLLLCRGEQLTCCILQLAENINLGIGEFVYRIWNDFV